MASAILANLFCTKMTDSRLRLTCCFFFYGFFSGASIKLSPLTSAANELIVERHSAGVISYFGWIKLEEIDRLNYETAGT